MITRLKHWYCIFDLLPTTDAATPQCSLRFFRSELRLAKLASLSMIGLIVLVPFLIADVLNYLPAHAEVAWLPTGCLLLTGGLLGTIQGVHVLIRRPISEQQRAWCLTHHQRLGLPRPDTSMTKRDLTVYVEAAYRHVPRHEDTSFVATRPDIGSKEA